MIASVAATVPHWLFVLVDVACRIEERVRRWRRRLPFGVKEETYDEHRGSDSARVARGKEGLGGPPPSAAWATR